MLPSDASTCQILEFPWNCLWKRITTKNSPFWEKNTKSYKKFKKGDTPLKVQFYYQDNLNLPLNTFSRAWQWHRFDFCLIITFLLENWLFAGRFSNCYNSLNFEAMTYWNTSKENFKKWRTKCTGKNLDFEPFYSRQMQIEKVNS